MRLPILLGLIIYGLIMAVLTVWLIRHHRRQLKSSIHIFDPSRDNQDQMTRSAPKPGQQ